MRKFCGREKIKTDVFDITRENVLEVLSKAMIVHERNKQNEEALWKIYKGDTRIYRKKKEFRENINNILSENRAMQIVEFYQGYIFGEPIQYIRRGDDESISDEIAWLNDIMNEKDKISLDDELAEWMLVCGVCPRLTIPSKANGVFEIYTLDPRYAFNVYYNGLGEEPVMSVKYIIKDDLPRVFSIYTKDRYFEIKADMVVKEETHILGRPPLVEYCLNNARLGVFEPVITILDGLNTLQSNRLDDVQQFVNSILAIIGAEISEETLEKLKEYGALSLPDGTDAKYLNAAMSQNDIQTLKNDLIQAVTEITGMPNRNGGSSTSDTGSAVLLRDGWEIADAKSKRIENQFKKAERHMLKMALGISKDIIGTDLSVGDIEIRFTRRNYEGIQTKSQVLTTMLKSEKIHPELAFTHCGMFADPLSAYNMSREYYQKEVKDAKDNNRETPPDAGDGSQEIQE